MPYTLPVHIIVCSKNSLVLEAAALAFQSRPAEAGSPFGSDRPRLTVCESGLEVLGAVEIVDADLVILDMQTPGLSGPLMISAIRELAPDLPILALSSTPQEEARALSYKGVSYATLPSDGQWDGQGLVTTLAQIGGARGTPSSGSCGERGRGAEGTRGFPGLPEGRW